MAIGFDAEKPEHFETGFNLGESVTLDGRTGVIKQIVIETGRVVSLLVDFGDRDERRIDAAKVTKA